MNEVILIGRLAKDAELKFTSREGKSVATFTLAVERKISSKKGERETDFINCVAWDKAAEVVSQYSSQGRLLSVSGRLKTRSFIDKERIKRYVIEVICNEINIVEGSNSAG